MLVKSSDSGNWFPNSSLEITFVKSKGNDAKGFYEILGVSPNASSQEIKQAARKLMLENHPDKGGNEADFLKVRDAYETLSNSEKRALYDREEKASELTLRIKQKKRMAQKFDSLFRSIGTPCYYKESDEILDDSELKKISEWIGLLLQCAREFKASFEVKAAISGKIPTGLTRDNIAVLARNENPERWKAKLAMYERFLRKYD